MNIICEIGEWLSKMSLVGAVEFINFPPDMAVGPEVGLAYNSLCQDDLDNLERISRGPWEKDPDGTHRGLCFMDSGIPFFVNYHIEPYASH